MKIDDLSLSYLKKAQVRYKALFFYKDNEAYSERVAILHDIGITLNEPDQCKNREMWGV